MSEREYSKEDWEKIARDSDVRPWKFFMPTDDSYIEKSLKQDGIAGDKDPTSWKLGGIASSSIEDLENEIVVPEGIDTTYYVKYGYWNSDHKKGAAFKVGIPTKAETRKEGLWHEGYLLKDMPEAQGIWALIKTLKEGAHPRRVGWSIEGKTILQEGRKILKSFLIDTAVTANPVCVATYAEILKSLSICKKDNSLESLDYLAKSSVPSLSDEPALPSLPSLPTVDKTIDAGYATSGQTQGDALRCQDLERKLKILTNKGLSPDEALEYVMLKTGVAKDVASNVLKYSDIYKKLLSLSRLK